MAAATCCTCSVQGALTRMARLGCTIVAVVHQASIIWPGMGRTFLGSVLSVIRTGGDSSVVCPSRTSTQALPANCLPACPTPPAPQPRFAIFRMFDDVLLLGKGGHLAYAGPSRLALAYLETLGFGLPPNENPAGVHVAAIQGAAQHAGCCQLGTLILLPGARVPADSCINSCSAAPQLGIKARLHSLAFCLCWPSESTALLRVKIA